MPPSPSTAAPTHHVFVDFENVPDIELGLIDGHPVRVTLLIGKNQKKLDLALVHQIHRHADRVELIEVGVSGRNALDLTLACYLGCAVQQTPEMKFHIVSNDKDFDPLIAHLKDQGHAVSRHASLSALPFLPRPKRTPPAAPVKSATPVPVKKPAPAVDRPARVTARLQNPSNRNRPARKKALLAYLKAELGKETTDALADEFLAHLCETNVLSIDAKGKVSYALN